MKNNGFSLVELLIVIAIMAILAGVAVPVYSHYVQDAKKGRDNDYMAEIYRLACLEAAGEGLEVDTVVVAIESGYAVTDTEETYDFKGKLAVVKFVGETSENTADFDEAEKRIIQAVWTKTQAYTFEYEGYMEWAANPGVQGVFYTREASGDYPYTIEGYVDQVVDDNGETQDNNVIELPSISL